MKRKENNSTQALSRFLDRFFNASDEQVESAGDRVLHQLHEEAAKASDWAGLEPDAVAPIRNVWRRAAVCAGIGVMLVVVSAIVWRKNDTDIVATSADGRTYAAGQLISANEGKNSMLTLADGSRVEMRDGSEGVLERAADGLRIRLNAGSIIVNAAQQAAGRHLYVSTRDVVVSVVGTVFLVKADERGSHVAVIRGEVRVKQGAVEKSLRPGEQVSSTPKSELAMQVEIGWSREAAAYLAMLHEELARTLAARQSSPAPPPAPAPPSSPAAPEKPQFEQASIRPCTQDFQAPQGMRGGGSNSIRLSPGRLDALCMTVATLIRTATRPLNNNSLAPALGLLTLNMTYGLGMEDGTRVRGGPDWVRSEKYTVAAVAGKAMDARTLQGPMLMALLEDRFQLKTHIAMEPIPVFALTIAKGGLKMKRAGRDDCVVRPTGGPRVYDPVERRREYEAVRAGATPPCGFNINLMGPNVVHIAGALSISSLAQGLSEVSQLGMTDALDGRLVLNKTGIPDTDTFNFLLEYEAADGVRARFGARPDGDADIPTAPGVIDAVELQLGLKLERAQGSREFVVIDRIERPSPN